MELFHRIADPVCARVRKSIVAWGLESHIRFRNIDTGPEAKADLSSLSHNFKVPSLKADQTFLEGEQAILDYLKLTFKL